MAGTWFPHLAMLGGGAFMNVVSANRQLESESNNPRWSVAPKPKWAPSLFPSKDLRMGTLSSAPASNRRGPHKKNPQYDPAQTVTRRRKDPRRSRNMPYRRRRRRRRRRRTRRHRMPHTMPQQYRIKHRLDYKFNLPGQNTTSAPAIAETQETYASNLNLQFDVSANQIHDPLYHRVANSPAAITGHSPTWYDEMAALYTEYKVNNCFIILDVFDNRPHRTVAHNATAVGDGYCDGVNLPDILAVYPILSGEAVDAHFPLRHGVKETYLTPGKFTRVTYKLNPSKFLGVPNSFSALELKADGATALPDKHVQVRIDLSPQLMRSTGTQPRVYIRMRAYWDVTWAHLKSQAFDN